MARKNDYINRVDNYIGEKVYLLRLAQGLSRSQLAQSIGVTHQQLLKYEKGTNRLSIGRLMLLAKALNKDVPYFYDGLDDVSDDQKVTDISSNFVKIKNSNHQTTTGALVKALSKSA